MNRRALRSTAAWLILLIVGCSGGGGGCGGGTGCGGGGCANIPGGFPAAKRASNAISAELSGQGIQYFQDNLTALVGTILGSSNGLSLNVPCIEQTQNVAVLGDVTVHACCSHACNVMAAINSVTITPSTAPDRSVDVNIVLSMNVNTGSIPVEVPVEILGIGLCTIGCNLSYAQQNIPIDVTLNLKVDPAWGDILAVNVMGIDLSELIDVNELNINSQGGICSGIACGALDLDFIKQTLFQFLTPTLNTTVQDAIDGFRCQKCDTARWSANGGCPTSTQTTNPPVASCQNDACFIGAPSAHKCVPTELGLQGRMNAGSLLASFGGPPDALLDIYAMAGGRSTNSRPTTYVDSGGGIVIGVMGGSDSPVPAACVPPHTAPTLVNPDPIDFKAAATQTGLPPVTDYAAGIAVSAPFMNKALFDAYNAGLLCLNVDSSLTSFLSSAVFQGTLLPSLGVLTHGQNVPMAVALRPKNPPTILVGKGTTKMVNGMVVPDDPLLTIQMKQLQLDFYALIEERQVRLFSLTTDLSLPLSLNFDAVAGTVTPALGDLSALLTNTTASNSEMLAEDPAQLAALVESVIGLVQPLIGGILQPIALPTFQGLTVGVSSARGAVPNRTGVGYQQMALFASLALAHPDTVHVDTTARLAEGVVPSFANIVGGSRQLPFAVIDAQANGIRSLNFAGYEYAYRVDNGLWSPWVRNARFEVHSPVFLIQGRHNIELVAREIDQQSTVDATPASVEFVVDYEAPQVRFEVVDGQLMTVASDSVWKDALQYRYSVDGGAWSSPGAPQQFTLADLNARGSVEVEVIDGSGLSTKARYGVKLANITTLPDSKHNLATPSGGAQGGCNQGGFPAAVGLLLVVMFLSRRRHA